MANSPDAQAIGAKIFNGDSIQKGYHLNQFCMSLLKDENRQEFRKDERAYLDRWKMTEDQKKAVLDRDYRKMVVLGGNVYFLAKLFSCDGKSMVYLTSQMADMSEEDFEKMMQSGGRSPDDTSYLKDDDVWRA